MRNYILIISILLFSPGWCVAMPDKSSIAPECCDYSALDPIQFLDLLTEKYSSGVKVFRVKLPPKDWVKQKHLSDLIDRLTDKTSCSAVSMPHSSHIARNASTVGREAAYLIEFHRTGTYSSGLKEAFDLDEKELEMWYKNKHNQ